MEKENDNYTYNGNVRIPYYNKLIAGLSFIESGKTHPRYVILGRLFGAMNENILNRMAFEAQLKEEDVAFENFKKQLKNDLEIEFLKVVKELTDVELKIFLGVIVSRIKPSVYSFEDYQKTVFKNMQYIEYSLLNKNEVWDNSLYWKTKDLVNYMYITVEEDELTVNPDDYSIVLDNRLRLLPQIFKIRPDVGNITPLTIEDLSFGTGSYMMAKLILDMDGPFIEKMMSKTYLKLVQEAKELEPKMFEQLVHSIRHGDLKMDFSHCHNAIISAMNNWPAKQKEEILIKTFEDFMNNRTQIYETSTLGSVLLIAELSGLKIFSKLNKDVLTKHLVSLEDVGNGHCTVTLDLVTQAKILLLSNLKSSVYPNFSQNGKSYDIFEEIMGLPVEKKANVLFKNDARHLRKFMKEAQSEKLSKDVKNTILGPNTETLYKKLGNIQEMMFKDISHIINSLELGNSEINEGQDDTHYKLYVDKDSGETFVGKSIVCSSDVAPFVKEALLESLFTTKESWKENLKIRCTDVLMRKDLEKQSLVVNKVLKPSRKF